MNPKEKLKEHEKAEPQMPEVFWDVKEKVEWQFEYNKWYGEWLKLKYG